LYSDKFENSWVPKIAEIDDRQIVFAIERCVDNSCASKKEIDKYIDGLKVNGYFLDSKVNFTSFDSNPVTVKNKKLYEPSLYKDRLTNIALKLRNNSLETLDS
jgi:hypothetical protein